MRIGSNETLDGHGADGFVGRTAELAKLSELAEKVRTGAPQVIWVHGPAGIGKTTMVRRFLSDLTGFAVLHAAADPSESVVPYGIVDQLVRRVPQRAQVPLLASGIPDEANPLAVGARLLDLLGLIQAGGSVALVVDDVQWIDAPSAHALGFVLRRVWADQVLVVLLARPAEDSHSADLLGKLNHSGGGAVSLELTGLGAGEVSGLALAMTGRRLPVPAAERLRDYTGGHPLHLRTLLADVPLDQLADRHSRLALPRSVVTAVRASLERLPEPSRRLLDGLAVLGTRSPLARVAQVAGVREPSVALQPALDAGLVTWWPNELSSPVAIAHDLQREAIYNALPPSQRSSLHAKAAEVVDPAGAWGHRVAAATATDADLADRLEAAAEEESKAGRHDSAARYLRWAADLSPERADYERRIETSCVQVLFSSDHAWALRLRPKVLQCAPSALRSLCLGLTSLLALGEWGAAQRSLTTVMRLAEQDGEHVPRWVRGTAAAGLAAAYTWGGDAKRTVRVAKDALDAGDIPVLMRDYTRVLMAVARSRIDGMAAALDELDHLPRIPSAASVEHLESLACRGAIRAMLGRFVEAKRDLSTVVQRHRTGTYLMSGTVPYCYLAATHYQLGEWDDASIVVRQALSFEDLEEQAQNQTLRRFAATLVPAGRGDWATATEQSGLATRFAQQIGGPQDLRYAALAEAILRQAMADRRGMVAALTRVPGITEADPAEHDDAGVHEWWSLWWRPLLTEGLIGVGELDAAETELTALRVSASGVRYMASTVMRLSSWHMAASGDVPGAVEAVEAFFDRPRGPSTPLADGLLEHDHGRRLLMVGRPGEAGRVLRSAKQRFARLGALPFEQRVDEDLARLEAAPEPVGVPAPRRPDVLAGLTDREGEVAHLVGRSLTNREIGAELYVTTKTVEYHLGNIYAKLGITSRRQLRDLLAERPHSTVPRDSPRST
ncbi:helix-turn-helix transcriptional regulator [Labedaea rhizosphaerae]|uniref:Regulatory LuxR family protein n=1 Tax=Labedaea rhizosphaerae TaxID=598644 RepID=A0A4R6SHI3_LABRH|nr:LuxR family transcriptional regulator [Labedaea rhizosphaerae]TDQ01010.1 regulatory LuxR family protein [Labedaea rhizosphaerae]